MPENICEHAVKSANPLDKGTEKLFNCEKDKCDCKMDDGASVNYCGKILIGEDYCREERIKT